MASIYANLLEQMKAFAGLVWDTNMAAVSLFFYGTKQGRHFSRNLSEIGVARSEELEVNQ